jgi:hypothetical protein
MKTLFPTPFSKIFPPTPIVFSPSCNKIKTLSVEM